MHYAFRQLYNFNVHKIVFLIKGIRQIEKQISGLYNFTLNYFTLNHFICCGTLSYHALTGNNSHVMMYTGFADLTDFNAGAASREL